jgi:hypothetical protein
MILFAQVLILFLLETIFVVFQIKGNYASFGSGWGDVEGLDHTNWATITAIWINGLSKFLLLLLMFILKTRISCLGRTNFLRLASLETESNDFCSLIH